jgi:hypothetical protein
MKTKLLVLTALSLLLFGCSAAMVMNGKVMGISSGKFIYEDGYLTTLFKADIEPVWQACEKAVVDLKGWDVQKDRKISNGTIKAIIAEENVTIRIDYIEKDRVSVSVFSGVTGNKMASRIIMDKIAANLPRP